MVVVGADPPYNIPEGAVILGWSGRHLLYVKDQRGLDHFYEFILFIIEASAEGSTGGSASGGKGTKPKAFFNINVTGNQ